jgi:YgiT-type zinc finger domain-containing protein
MKKCYICGGDMKHNKVVVEREWGGKRIIIQDVPQLDSEKF